MQFDELEDCFQLSINVFELNPDTLEINKIRDSEKMFDNILNILDYNGHAMYITNIDTVLSKYPCNVCGAVFDVYEKLKNHKKTKCEFEVIESFCKKPTNYRPAENPIKKMLTKYKIENIDHYLGHFIVYDFEANLEGINEQRGENSRYTSRHKAVSVSICNSLSNEVKCFVNNDPKAPCRDV